MLCKTAVNIPGLTLVRLNPGDDLLLSLREAVKNRGIKNALIVTGLGSVKSYHCHVVDSIDLPPKEAFPKGEKPLDLVNVNGLVMEGRVHAHVIFADAEKTLGGHMEEGCTVLTFAIVALLDLGETAVQGWDSIKSLG